MKRSKRRRGKPAAEGDGLKASRRDFLKLSATGVVAGHLLADAGPAEAARLTPKAKPDKFEGGRYPKARVRASGRVIGANDRIHVAHIGVGGMGSRHVELFQEHAARRNTLSIAVCDVLQTRVEKNEQVILEHTSLPLEVQTHKDYRRILDNEHVDAVVIATPEHWHGQIAVHALEAGKHVYVEKPMTRYLDEAFQLLDAQRRSGKAVQVGAIGCSDPKWLKASEMVASGALGELVMAQGSYMRNTPDGAWNYEIDESVEPPALDWELWQGSAKKRPWSAEARDRFFRYRKYWDYSAGILGDLMPHRILPLLMAMQADEYPVRVAALGTRAVSTDREVDDTVQVLAEFPSGWSMLFIGSTVNEQGLRDLIRGQRATLYMGDDEVSLQPERPYAEEFDAVVEEIADAGAKHHLHQDDWIEGVRTGKKPNCDVLSGAIAQTIVSLAEMSSRLGRTMTFDARKREWKAG